MGRSAFLAWSRLQRLHRLIEEERWEIEHHRSQEREELAALYAAKGFSGKLLDEVIDVLMADDNRLLRVMLEEEMGLTLEIYEHPLRQALGAGVGVLCASALCLLGALAHPLYGLPGMAALLLAGSALMTAKLEHGPPLPALIWSLAVAFLGTAAVYFIHG